MRKTLTKLIIILLIVLSACIPVSGAVLVRERETAIGYEVLINGQGSQEDALRLAIEKCGSHLHKAIYAQKTRYTVRMRIENDGTDLAENISPQCIPIPDYWIQAYAITHEAPYGVCDRYKSNYKTDVKQCRKNIMDWSIQYFPVYMTTKREQNDMYSGISSLAKTFKGSEYDKIKGIYAYIRDNIKYKSSGYVANDQNGALTFRNKAGICTGFARLMAELCHDCGIECYEVGGKSITEEEYHSWVIVKCDGKWYFCDPTQEYKKFQYFLRGQKWWEENRFASYGYKREYYDVFFDKLSRTHFRKIRVNDADAQRPPEETAETASTGQPSIPAQPANIKQAQIIHAKVNHQKIKRQKTALKIKQKKWIHIAGATGTLSFIKKAGNKKIVVAKNGTITIRQDIKPGTYNVKITVTAAGNNAFLKAKKTVSLKVRILP